MNRFSLWGKSTCFQDKNQSYRKSLIMLLPTHKRPSGSRIFSTKNKYNWLYSNILPDEFINELLLFSEPICDLLLTEGFLPASQKCTISTITQEACTGLYNMTNHTLIQSLFSTSIKGYWEASNSEDWTLARNRLASKRDFQLRLISDICDAIDSGEVRQVGQYILNHAPQMEPWLTFGWLQSFLDEHITKMTMGSDCSAKIPILFSVPPLP